MRPVLIGLLAWAALRPWAAAAAGPPTAAVSLRPVAGDGAGRRFERQEFAVDAGAAYANPFDPGEVAVDATFTAADGHRLVVPGFWDERGGVGGFFVRLTPDAAGAWRGAVTVVDHGGRRTSAEVAFAVAEVGRAGFVRVAGNGRYFGVDGGGSYFPVGLNLCWPAPGGGAAWYDATFATLAGHGGNFARVWMSADPFKLESAATGLGRYDLAAAAYYDAVLDAADRHGVRVMLCLLNHREFLDRDRWGEGDWPKLPYNAAVGGPATRPADVFTHPDARRAFRNRLRYVVARYGASTAVGFWELFNEQENAGFAVPTAWNAEMTDYVAGLDPYRHPITTSASVPEAVWRLPAVGLTQAHVYGDGTGADLVTPLRQAARDHERFGKPFLIGETAADFKGSDERLDPRGVGTSFHNSLWAGLASGSAGTGMYWWWDSYVEPNDLWHEFGPVAAFAKDVDWAGSDFRPVAIDEAYDASVSGGAVDLVLSPAGGWGDTTHGPIMVPPGGRPRAAPLRYLYGPQHHGLSQPLTVELTVPPGGRLAVGVGQVSDVAVVRVAIDDQPVRDFLASPLSATTRPVGRGPADVDAEFAVYLPAGRHRVMVTCHAGDWATVSHVTFTGALAARYAHLSATAVQDAASGQTLAWVWDDRSTWRADRDGRPPPTWSAVEVVIPTPDGAYVCRWFDTRTGAATETPATAAAGRLVLRVPAFARDVAVRVRRADR